MLGALVTGVKGGKWYGLMDKVYAPKNLAAAWETVRENQGAAGVDKQSVAAFGSHSERYLKELNEDLKKDQYLPLAVRRQWIPKPGTSKQRPLGIPVVRDRVVQTALRNVLEPIWEAKFAEQSYGFRPGRGCKDALRRVEHLLQDGHRWIVDADIQSYFDTIDHAQLMQDVEKEVSDGRVLALLKMFLEQPVWDGMKKWLPEAGTPQGAVMSPLLANIYLHPVDLVLRAEGFEAVRYADDLVILCRTEQEAQRALAILREQLSARKLTLHPEKTRVVDIVQDGFDFLGYHFTRTHKGPRAKSKKALREKIRPLTKRNNGTCLAAIIAKINPILRGWFNYFKHSTLSYITTIDGWLRMRLRSILRRRRRGRGRGRGKDHQRWPNAYFRKLGLFTMAAAHEAITQSR
jgi:RNA-directed DNA polymerase